MARETVSKQTTFLRVGSDGYLYTGSKEPREGFTEYVSKQGNVSYRKTFIGTDFGKMTQLGIEEKTFDSGKVKYLSITVENEKTRDVIQLPLLTQKGGLSDVVRKFIAVLPGIDFSRDLTISSNRKKNERGYTDRFLFVNYVNDGEVEKGGLKYSLKFGPEGDVPPMEKKDGVTGVVWDTTNQDNYLYKKLLEQLERFAKERPTVGFAATTSETSAETTPETKNSPEPKEKATSDKKKVATDGEAKINNQEDEDDEDDLPF